MTAKTPKPAAGDRWLDRFLVEVADFKKIEGANHLRGDFSFTVARFGITIHHCHLLEAANGKRWIALPSRRFLYVDGKRGFEPLISFTSKAARREFVEEALAVAETYLKARGQW